MIFFFTRLTAAAAAVNTDARAHDFIVIIINGALSPDARRTLKITATQPEKTPPGTRVYVTLPRYQV